MSKNLKNRISGADLLSGGVNGAPLAVGHAGYLDAPAAQIYYVAQPAAGKRRTAVLICGPFAVERERAYSTLVTWACALAAQGHEAMRFDYRGIGESTGRFEELTISDWRNDVALCAAHLAAMCPGVPLILQGVRLGALIAAEVFASGTGDGLLLWAPPKSARDLMWDTMRRDLAAKLMDTPDLPRKTREEQIAAIEAGKLVNIEGYYWSPALWRDAEQHEFSAPDAHELRPWHILDTKRNRGASAGGADLSHRETVIADPIWESAEILQPRSEELIRASLRWLNGPAFASSRSPA